MQAHQIAKTIGSEKMRQTPMDRWIEAAEARRICRMAQEMRARPAAPTRLSNLLMTKLRSMARPQILSRRPARATSTPSGS
jgi:hypothetical protein